MRRCIGLLSLSFYFVSLIQAQVQQGGNQQLPAFFVENQQTSAKQGRKSVMLQTPSGPILFTEQGPTAVLPVANEKIDFRDPRMLRRQSRQVSKQADFVSVGFHLKQKSKRQLRPQLRDPLAMRVNFFKGPQSEWRTNLTVYQTLVYEQVWQDVDLVYRADKDANLLPQIHVRANADLEQVLLSLVADKAEIDAAGNVRLHMGGKDVVLPKPRAYTADGQVVDVAYTLSDDGHLGFEVSSKQARRGELVIAPELMWSTFLGTGGSRSFSPVIDIAVNQSEEALLVGYTTSPDFPVTEDAYDSTYNGDFSDAFILKLNADGSDVLFATFLGGDNRDIATSLVLDDSDYLYVTGYSESEDFPVTAGAVGEDRPGYINTFLAKFNSTTGDLVFSGLLGGDGLEFGLAIALDSKNNPVISGVTNPRNLTVTPGAYNQFGNRSISIHLAKVSNSGDSILLQTYFGGDWDDAAQGLALDDQDNIYLGGWTNSPNFPVTGTSFGSPSLIVEENTESFALKLNADASELLWSTTLRGDGNDYAMNLALNANNEVLLAGYTYSSNLQVTSGAYDTTYSGNGEDGFVQQLAADGEAVLFGTYFGDTGDDQLRDLKIRDNGQIVVSGYTGSESVLTAPGYTDLIASGSRAVVSQFTLDGSALDFTAMVSGSTFDVFYGLAIDSSGNLYVAGEAGSGLTTSVNAFNANSAGTKDPFVMKLNSDATQAQYATYLNAGNQPSGVQVAVDSGDRPVIGFELPAASFAIGVGAYDSSFNGASDILLARFSSDGSNLEWATYLGGGSSETLADLALDTNDDIYVTGFSRSTDYPVSGGVVAPGSGQDSDIFVSKLSGDGSQLLYSMVMGGNDRDEPVRIIVDHNGAVYVAGRTLSSDFPVTANAFDMIFTSDSSFDYDGFLFKLNANASELEYATYLGGIQADEIKALDVNSLGQAIVGGQTQNQDFPTTENAYGTTFTTGRSGFISQFDASGERLIFSTFLGYDVFDLELDSADHIYFVGRDGTENFQLTSGTLRDSSCRITLGQLASDGSSLNIGACFYDNNDVSNFAINDQGDLLFAYTTRGEPFPTTNNTIKPINPAGVGFVLKINQALSNVLFSSYYGGSFYDLIDDLAVDSAGDLFISGTTLSTDFSTTPGVYQESFEGSADAFVGKFDIPVCSEPMLQVPATEISVCEGQPFRLSLDMLGPGLPTVVWYKDGQVISGATSLNLQIEEPTTADNGVYSCVVTTGCGTDTSDPITLTIEPFEGFISHPRNVDACEGAFVSLEVVLASSGGTSYSWYRDGILVSSGSSDNVITEAFTMDASKAGTYVCEIQTDCGTVYSEPASVDFFTGTLDMEPTPVTQGSGLSLPRFEVELGCAAMFAHVTWQAFPDVDFSRGRFSATLLGPPQEDVRLEATVDYGPGNPVITKSVYYKYSANDQFRDFNGDGSNDAQDLYDLLALWDQPFANDADGDGKITILDTFYLPATPLE